MKTKELIFALVQKSAQRVGKRDYALDTDSHSCVTVSSVERAVMRMIDVHEQFSTEEKCLDYIEQSRWPGGVACVHCGVMNVSTINRETKGANKRKRIYQCLEKECGHQFSGRLAARSLTTRTFH